MKRVILIIALALYCTRLTYAETVPDWVSAKPASMIFYTGIGSATLTTPNYQLVAKEKALSDLIGEIEIEIESSSLLNREDINEIYSETFQQEIRSSATAKVEGHELVDSYNDGERYWVYYQLDKIDYQNLVQKRKADATSRAYNYWTKGEILAQSGDLLGAWDLFLSGLASIEDYANTQLLVEHQGKSVEIAVELYNSLKKLSSNLSITTFPSTLQVKPFSKEPTTVKVSILSGGTPIRNVPLNAEFINGDGNVSFKSKTGNDGTTILTVSNVTSKQPYQEIELRLNIQKPEQFATTYMRLLTDELLNKFPSVKIPIEIKQQTLKAILYTADKDISGLLNSISSYISNHYFDIVTDQKTADLMITVNSSVRYGGRIKGEMYDMIEVFASCDIIITDLVSGAIISNFGINDVRSLAPISASNSKIQATTQRELFKKLRPLIERNFKELHFTPRENQNNGNTIPYNDDSSTPKID